MTFPENSESIMQNEKRNTHVGRMLREVLMKAQKDDRTTFGIYECGKLLNTTPDDVTLCILPLEDNGDVTVHIHHTLMEAFCLENDIKLMKVDSLKKLEGIFPGNENSNTDAVDCSCILVTAPAQTDHVYNDLMDVADGPIVEMPA